MVLSCKGKSSLLISRDPVEKHGQPDGLQARDFYFVPSRPVSHHSNNAGGGTSSTTIMVAARRILPRNRTAKKPIRFRAVFFTRGASDPAFPAVYLEGYTLV